MSTTKPATKAPRSTSTKSTEHAHERKSEKQCLACGSEYVRSAAFCRRCYNQARRTKAAGKNGDELIAAVKATLAETKPPSKTHAASRAQSVTTDDGLEANAELYGAVAEKYAGLARRNRGRSRRGAAHAGERNRPPRLLPTVTKRPCR